MDLLEFVAHLKRRPWDDKNHPVHRFRVEFLKDPGGVMDAMGLIGAEDRAYICSLREIEIGDRVGINQHAMRIFASAMNRADLWPEAGNTRKHYWEDDTVCPQERGAANEPGTRWARPEHRIHKIYTETLYKQYKGCPYENEFIVVGEGFLPNATMTFSKGNAMLHSVACVPDDDHYHSCSIRQVYMRAFITLPENFPTGPCTLAIANVGWMQEPPLGPDATVYVENEHP